jgi:hypothetical protein
LTGAGKSLENVEEGFRSIIRLLGEFDDLSDEIKFSFLTEENKKKIESITASIIKYQKVLEQVISKEKSLQTARKTAEKDSGLVNKATKKVSDLSDKKSTAEARKANKQG